MANERYMTPGSAVADKLQEILAQRRSDKQQQLLMSLQMAQAQQGWENQQTDNARLDEQLQDNMKTNAATRLAAEQQMAEHTAESVGGGVDVARMNPTVAKRQQDFGYVTPLGMAAEGIDGPGQVPMMTSTAPSLLKRNAEMDLETGRRRALVDQMMLITDPREQAVFAESNGLKPVLQNWGRTFNSVTGKFGVPFKEGFGDGSTKTYEQRGFQPPTPGRVNVIGYEEDADGNKFMFGTNAEGDSATWPVNRPPGFIPVKGGGNKFNKSGGPSKDKQELMFGKGAVETAMKMLSDKKIKPDDLPKLMDTHVRTMIANNTLVKMITLPNGQTYDAQGAIRRAFDSWQVKRNPKRTPTEFLAMVQANMPPNVSPEDQANIEALASTVFSYALDATSPPSAKSWFGN